MVRAVPTVLCCAVLCCVTLLTLIYCVHSVLGSFCAVLNTSVFNVCVLLCVRPEVVAGKGRRPVETQKGPMVRIGNGRGDQTKNQCSLHVLCGKRW